VQTQTGLLRRALRSSQVTKKEAHKNEEKEAAMTKKKWKDEEKNSQKQKTKEKNQIKPSQKKPLKPKFSKKILGTCLKSFLILSTLARVFLEISEQKLINCHFWPT
jgi:hypothetical protein